MLSNEFILQDKIAVIYFFDAIKVQWTKGSLKKLNYTDNTRHTGEQRAVFSVMDERTWRVHYIVIVVLHVLNRCISLKQGQTIKKK